MLVKSTLSDLREPAALYFVLLVLGQLFQIFLESSGRGKRQNRDNKRVQNGGAANCNRKRHQVLVISRGQKKPRCHNRRPNPDKNGREAVMLEIFPLYVIHRRFPFILLQRLSVQSGVHKRGFILVLACSQQNRAAHAFNPQAFLENRNPVDNRVAHNSSAEAEIKHKFR